MHKRKENAKQRTLSLVVTFLSALYFCGFAWAGAKNDLLLRPAQRTKNITENAFMDIGAAGSRIVAVGEMGVIAYSDDYGLSWLQAKVPTSVTLTAVYFVNEKFGWAVGHDGVVLHSRNGGQSWQKQLDGNLVNKLVLEATKNVYSNLKNRIESANSVERVDLERDLEETSYLIGDAEYALKEGPTKPFFDVWFANERKGLIVGAFGLIFRTLDGGKNWIAMNSAIDNPEGYHYYGLAETKSALLLVGEAGTMHRSYDKGEHWESLDSPYVGSMFGVVGDQSGENAIAVGLRGKIVVMEESGKQLALKDSILPIALNAATFTSDGNMILVGLAGPILWQTAENGAFIPLRVKFPGCMSIIETKNMHLILAGLRGLKRVEKND
jgi:photosystem II stability/assembly factor-like uncharacterized protein